MGMSKRKQIILVSLVAVLLIAGIFTAIYVMRQREAARQLEIAETYLRLHYAFGMGSGLMIDIWLGWDGEYRPLREVDPERNRFGINEQRYLLLRYYERETGIVLSYEVMREYFSQEFEPNGLLRLHNNGKHPEIDAFVIWMWEGQRREEVDAYEWRIWHMYRDYVDANEDFIEKDFSSLSPQMLDALVRAEADPDYVLDLTSLQRAGY